MIPIPVSHANALNFLRGKLPANDVNAVRALLAGDLSRAETIIAGDEYTAPKDDVAKGVSDLLEFLKGCMKPEDYVQAEVRASKIMQASKQRIEDHHAALNEATSKVGDEENDEPKGMDSNLRRALRAAAGTGDAAHKKLRAHMARIGNV